MLPVLEEGRLRQGPARLAPGESIFMVCMMPPPLLCALEMLPEDAET